MLPILIRDAMLRHRFAPDSQKFACWSVLGFAVQPFLETRRTGSFDAFRSRKEFHFHAPMRAVRSHSRFGCRGWSLGNPESLRVPTRWPVVKNEEVVGLILLIQHG